MKIKYFILKITGFFLLGWSTLSCNKMLDIPSNSPNQIVTGQVFADSVNAINGVVGIYNSAFSNLGSLSGWMSIYPSLSADEIISSISTYQPVYNNQLVPGDVQNPLGSTGNIWNGFYAASMIYQCNAAIEALASSSGISEGLKQRLTGECEFVRSLNYFYLTSLYGAVPIATSTNYLVNNRLPRSSAEDVYTQILKDLTSAVNKLPVEYPTSGRARPNKYTAMALLSRVYLYRQQWEKADSVASAIINSATYTLESPERVFIIGNNEAIWQAVSSAYYSYLSQEGPTFIPYASSITPYYALRDTLLNSFEPGDLRLSKWTAFNTVDGVKYYYPYKYKNTYGVQANGNVEGEVLFRLAEQYLIRAEARIKENNLAGAADDINVIRSRAGLGNTGATSTDELTKALIHEKQIEFFCEWGHRWFDLRRWGLLNTTMNAVKPGLWPADGHAALYPISYDQMTSNPGWTQNPGY